MGALFRAYFVPGREEPRFIDIVEDLTAIVVFVPAKDIHTSTKSLN